MQNLFFITKVQKFVGLHCIFFLFGYKTALISYKDVAECKYETGDLPSLSAGEVFWFSQRENLWVSVLMNFWKGYHKNIEAHFTV